MPVRFILSTIGRAEIAQPFVVTLRGAVADHVARIAGELGNALAQPVEQVHVFGCAEMLGFVAGWDGFLAHHSETLKRIDSAADIDAARAAS
jgi:hypothetical protein